MSIRQISSFPAFNKAYKKIPQRDQELINEAFSELRIRRPLPDSYRDEPLVNRKLKKRWPKVRKIRPNHNSYRLAYFIDEDVVYLVFISRRKDFYKQLERNF